MAGDGRDGSGAGAGILKDRLEHHGSESLCRVLDRVSRAGDLDL